LAAAPGPRIEALLAALRAAGLGLGVTGSLRVAEVLRAAAREAGGAEGRAIDAGELRDLLRCVVACTMAERATFDRVFGAWSDLAQGDLGRRVPGLGEPPRPPELPAAPRPERRRPARWLPRIVAAAALGGVLAVSALAWRFWPRVEVTGAGAGPIEDAGAMDQGDAGVLVAERPTTFRARRVVFTVEPPQAERALPWQLALMLVSAALAIALGRFVRRSSWLPRVLAPPRVPGPPEVPPLPIAEGPRGAGLLGAGERDELAFAVDRFIREEPSPEVDAPRSVDATVAAGGRAEIVFRPRVEHRTVWLWTDAASSSPLVPRFAAEVAASLASAGLPNERGRFACVPDRVDSDERGALEPREIEDAAMGSAVLLVTDGEGLARRLGDSASRGWVRPVLRVLSRWPRVAFVAVAGEGRRALSAAFARFDVGVSVIAPDEVNAFLAGQDARRAVRERSRMAGDTLAWAAGCCLGGRRVDAAEALALRAAMKLDAPVWDVEAVLADVAAVKRRDRLRWLAQVSGAGHGGEKVPKGSPLGLALAFFRERLTDEDEERTRRDAEDPWVDTPARRELLRRVAVLDLWTAPDEALAALHERYASDDPARGKALAGYAAGANRVELRAPEGLVGLPWAVRDLEGASPVLAQGLGLRVIGAGEERWRAGVPGRAVLAVGTVLGLCVGAGVGAGARWARRPAGAPVCVAPEGGWCAAVAGGRRKYEVVAGGGRVMERAADVPAGARVTAAWGAEMRFPCEERVDATTSIRQCGKREAPVPRGPGWVMRHSVGVVEGENGDAERDAWADALLDSGSADRVVVASNRTSGGFLGGLAALPGFQVLVIDLTGGPSSRLFLQDWAVAELVATPAGRERDALAGTEVRSVAETWSHATIRSGQPQLAGVAVAAAEVHCDPNAHGEDQVNCGCNGPCHAGRRCSNGVCSEADAPPVADPVEPINKSSECPHREVEDNGLVFVRVCGGTFQMGSKDDDKDAQNNDEKPAHAVTVSTFWIGKYEVSNAEYRKLDPDHARNENADLPATRVSWDEAGKMCASLGHRLPTEAEWEYAARGPEGRKYPWGDAELTDKLAVFGWTKMVAVKSYLDVASPFGTVHQAGNALEWVQDCYETDAYRKRARSATDDPLINCPAGGDRVLRGGSFDAVLWDPRSAIRSRTVPKERYIRIGFRCARGTRRQP
jgi:formylglycine-generating enzyme required for sulfatase activity